MSYVANRETAFSHQCTCTANEMASCQKLIKDEAMFSYSEFFNFLSLVFSHRKSLTNNVKKFEGGRKNIWVALSPVFPPFSSVETGLVQENSFH